MQEASADTRVDTQLCPPKLHPPAAAVWLLLGLRGTVLGGTLHGWEVEPREEVLAGPRKMLRAVYKGNLGVWGICNMVY